MDERREKVREALKVIKEECNRCFSKNKCRFYQNSYNNEECLIRNSIGKCISDKFIVFPYDWNIK